MMSESPLSATATPIAVLGSSQATTALQTANLASDQATGSNIDAVSTDFEAVFLSQMLGAMFSGDETSSYFGSGTAGEVYKSNLLNEYGKLMAKAGGIGIASQVKQELLKLQEVHTS